MPIDPLAIVPTIVDVGLARLFREQGNGFKAELSHVAVGRGLPDGAGWKGYTPTRALTRLQNEDARVQILSGSLIEGRGFRVLARIPRAAEGVELPVREVAFILSTGEPLAIWSEIAPAPLAVRTPRAEYDFAFDLYLAQVPLSALTINVQQPDIPDTAGVLASLLSCQIRQFIAATDQDQRLTARGFY